MTTKDWAMFAITLLSGCGWFLSWWNHRVLMIEMRGIKGYKFRAMWREYASEHKIPINGEDTD